MNFFDAYFVVTPAQYRNHEITLQHDSGDILPLTQNINAFKLYSDSEKVIVKTRLQAENLESFLENVSEGINPFSYEGAACLGLSKAYIGHTFEEVLQRFPELSGTKIVVTMDEQQNEIITQEPYIQDTTIA